MSSDSDSSEECGDGEVYIIKSVHNNKLLTFVPADSNKFVMAARNAVTGTGSEQKIVRTRVDTSGSPNNFYLHVYSKGHTLDFYPQAEPKDRRLYPSEPNSGTKKVWTFEKKPNEAVWMIKSSDGGYWKNDGSGSPKIVYSPPNLRNKKLLWVLQSG